ncbi:MAG TPA: sigma-70 family RNA polymerase sigma factor [Pyrinomonadaceae bacterium]|jgi:RNA polymerase sigma factor (sigma-70 family)
MLKPRIASPTHEEVFLQRYERLRLSALYLVQNDQQLAEDLLHDVFLQFTVSQPNLKTIENLDGYLYRMLRNMHLSQLRRTSRMREATRPLLDYDSATAGLETLRNQTEVQARDELRRICEYALLRKNTSKAASVLILRFFHAYYPAEIAQVLCKSRNVVDQELRAARAEAKAYLTDPGSLAFMNENPKAEPLGLDSTNDTDDPLLDFRKLIFLSPAGACPTRDDLQQLFQPPDAEGPDCKTLAHLVCCEPCLNTVSATLGLPLLSTRHPEKTLVRDSSSRKKSGGGPPAGGGDAGGGEMDGFVKHHRRRVKEVLEHHPKELRISVNGFIVGAHTVNSELSKQTLTVNLEERISFVEVFSDRDVRMLFCSIDPPPDGPGAYRELIRLSDGRSLELNLDFAESSPQINVIYNDPTYRAAPVAQTSDSAFVDSVPASIPERARFEKLRGLSERVILLLKSLRARLVTPQFWLRPATVTSVFALILVGVLTLLYRHVPAPPVTAPGLLAKATVAEEVDAARVDQVLHRTISLEEKTTSGELIARRKLEVWQSSERGITARRLYDDRGQLVAGDWRRADGVQTLYHHGTQPKLQLAPDKNGRAALTFENVWELSPSAKEFTSLIGSTDEARLEERPTGYVVSYEDGGQLSALERQGLIKATLTLSRADLHAVAQTLLVQQGAEIREYHFVEVSLERRAPATVAPAVFEPDAVLVSERTNDEGGRIRTDSESVHPSSLIPHPSVVATAELEVEVLQRLNQVGAFLGEQLSLTRTSDGSLLVQGILETDQRKSEILRALGDVAHNPAVRVQVETVAEAQKRETRRSPGSITLQGVQVTGGSVPVEADLRNYFSSKRGFSGEALDQEVRRFSTRIFNRSIQVRLRALALTQIAERFSPADLQTMDREAWAKWRAMVNEHARAFRREVGMLRHELEPIFPALSSETSGMEISSDADLARAARRLFEISAANDEGIRRSFSVSADNSKATAVKTESFWRALSSAESLAEKIQRAVGQ